MDFENYLLKNGEPISLERGEHLFRQGDGDGALYLVQEGLLKAYYLTSDGKEQIKSFMEAGKIIGSLTAAYEGSPNTFSLMALEPAELVKFSFDDMRLLSKTTPDIAERMTDLLLSLAMKKERREYELLCLSAEERYQLLLERSPNLPMRVTQQDIALYLGITPVALSRIKKRLTQ
jgi:CRP-like cAMP-binding protein